jgi:hypothetical protein
MTLSVKQVCEKIWQMETDLRLFDTQVHGVTVWPLMRMSMYYKICTATDVFSTPHSERLSAGSVAHYALNTIKAPFRTSLHGGEKKKYLVFDHPRKVLVGGAYVDIYTESLLALLPSEDTEVFENWYEGRHWTTPMPNRHVLDDLAVGAALAQMKPLRLKSAEKDFVAEIEKRVQADFGIRVSMRANVKKEIRHHLYCVQYFLKLLRAKQPERVFLVVSYSWYKRALIVAAKQLGIETVELQHGTFSPYHLGYNFPLDTGEVACFPERFYSFGNYWNKLARLPIEPDKIETHGFAHFHNQLKHLGEAKKEAKRILFISQGVIGKHLAVVGKAVAELLPDYTIAYKLHPGEYTLWKTDYPELMAASELPNVEVLDNSNSGLYEQFAASKYLVGAFSTAIYEGLALGCVTFIVDVPGVEYMDGLVENNIVFKAKNANEIAELIGKGERPTPIQQDDFFAPVK